MRCAPWLFLAACSFQPTSATDGDDVVPPDGDPSGDAYVLPDPEVFPGGGIGGGPIVAGINVYAIDENTHAPIAGADVLVGAISGTTDATGLFSTTLVSGKQTILITSPDYRPQMWVGVQGANVTMQLRPTTAAPPSGLVTGDVTGFSSLAVAPGHSKRATVGYTQLDNASDPVNSIPTPGDTNRCTAASGSPSPCSYAVKTRTGKATLFAPIVDIVGNQQSIITYGFKTGLTIGSGSTSVENLTLVNPGDLVGVTTNFGTAPAGLSTVFGLLEVDIPEEGVAILTATVPSFTAKMPPLAMLPTGTTYRLVGLAVSGDQRVASVSIRRNLTTTSNAVGTWLEPPQGVVASRTSMSFTPSTGTFHTFEIKNDNGGSFFAAVIFDDSTAITYPASLVLPIEALDAVVQNAQWPLDVTNFSFDVERAKLSDLGVRSTPI